MGQPVVKRAGDVPHRGFDYAQLLRDQSVETGRRSDDADSIIYEA